MPRGRPKKQVIPQKSLSNITNLLDNELKRNCVVKVEKMNMQTNVNDTSIKRKTKETNENEVSPRKKQLQQVAAQSPPQTHEHSVENVIKKYEQLQKVISNKYVTVVDRLKLDFVPVCAENIEYCHRKHYKNAAPPKLAPVTAMNLMRNSLQQARYKVFMSLIWSSCNKEEFPGDSVLTNIVKLILTINPEEKHNAYLQPILGQLACVFDTILKTFPPCWLALRDCYTKFLRNTMEMSTLLPDKTLHAENTVFEVVIMLLEDVLADEVNTKNNRSSRKKKELNTSLTTFDVEYHNMQHWEKFDNDEQTFSALSKATRIDRLMQVLHFIAKMLEMDLAMWMLRYNKNPSKHIYNESEQPLVISLFSLSQYTRSSLLVKKVMSLFSLCVEKDLDEFYLRVMDRFISLLAHVQNLCEIENTPGGIRYPNVGPRTLAFTTELHKTAEINMKTNVYTYLRLIKALRCPFVRYEYIDIFLKRLNPAQGRMTPQKIFENFRKNRWQECESDDGRSLDESKSIKRSNVYREDYLFVLSEALRNYCEFHGTKDFLDEIRASPPNVQENPQESNKNPPKSKKSNVVDLSKIKKRIAKFEKTVGKSVNFRAPRTEIPVVNIAVYAELYSQYRNDIKYVINLLKYISALQEENEQDFSCFIEYLKYFAVQ